MKYGKIISKILTKRENNNGMVAVALVAGLAAGAVISVLLAPESGADTRKALGDKARGLGNDMKNSYGSLKDRIFGVDEVIEPIAAPEVPHFIHTPPKRRRSDIKDVINEFHNGEHHNEQPI